MRTVIPRCLRKKTSLSEKLEALREEKRKVEDELRLLTTKFNDTAQKLDDTTTKLEGLQREFEIAKEQWDSEKQGLMDSAKTLIGEHEEQKEIWKKKEADLVSQNDQLNQDKAKIQDAAEQTQQELGALKTVMGVESSDQLQQLATLQLQNDLMKKAMSGN